jgi:hypothetical protein
MTDTIGLLNHYRLSLLNDKDAFYVLTFIYRNLSATSQELSKGLDSSQARLGRAIRDLYRAGWIETPEADLFFLSQRSASLMQALEVTDIAMSSLGREMVPSLDSNSMLYHWFERSSHPDLKASCVTILGIGHRTKGLFEDLDESLWSRVFNAVFNYAEVTKQHLSILTTNYDNEIDRLTKNWPSSHNSDLKSLRHFWSDCELPTEKDSRAVVLRSALLLFVYSLSTGRGLGVDLIDYSQTSKCASRLWREFDSDNSPAGGALTNLLIRCVQQMLNDPDYKQSDAGAGDPKGWADQLFSATTEK